MSITPEQLAKYNAAFDANPMNTAASNVCAQHELKEAFISREVEVRHDHQFSDRLPQEGKPQTNQRASGRCWLFALCNVLRVPIIAEQKCEELELSQGFLFFWDKFEKANFFLDAIIKTRAESVDSRIVAHLLTAPVNDGGQYDMAINVVEKYGLCPKQAYPEHVAQTASRSLNWLVTNRLREFALTLREKTPEAELEATKERMMGDIYRILCVSLGRPPSKFDWCFKVKGDGAKTAQFLNLTPKEFYERFAKQHIDVSQQVSLINDPRNEYFKLYTVEYLGNVVGGRPVLYVNLPVEKLKEHASRTIKAGRPVWFGCDVGKFFHRQKGIMDLDIFAYDLAVGAKFDFAKAERLRYGESLMTHAMVLTAVDERDGKTVKWRVENSWGDKGGDKGYLSMSDDWFSEYLYQIVLPKGDLPKDITDVLSQEPTALPAWDPMGALAKEE